MKVVKFKADLTGQQIELFEKTNLEQVRLFNFALNYLYKKFSYKKIEKFLPTGQKANFLIADIRKRAKEKGILAISHSQISDQTIKGLITNFSQYRKHIYGLNHMSDNKKEEYYKKHKKSWYKAKRVNFIKDLNKVFTLRIPNNNQTRILSSNKIKIQAFKDIKIKGRFNQYQNYKISLVNLKRFKNGTFELQVTLAYNTEKPKLTKKSLNSLESHGYDWGLKGQSSMISDDGLKINFRDKTDHKLEELLLKIRRTGRKLSKEKKNSNTYNQLQQSLNKFYAKRSNIVKQELWMIANTIIERSDIIIIEDLTPKSMRYKTGENKGFNRKLSLRQPGQLIQYIQSSCDRHNKLLIKVNPYKTSQVDFETKEVNKKDLSVREYINSLGNKVDRDINAAKNIKYWGLNPEEHIGFKENKLALENIRSCR